MSRRVLGRAVGGFYFIFLLDSSALHTAIIPGVSKGWDVVLMLNY